MPGPQGAPGPSTGPAGGALAGSYPNPGLAPGAVGTAALATLPGARAKKGASDQTLNTGSATDVDLATEEYDTGALYSPARTRWSSQSPGRISSTET